MKSLHFSYLFFLLIFILSCNPKHVEEASETDNVVIETVDPNVRLSDCPKFGDNKYSEDAINAYSLYSRFINLNKYEQALEYWETVYKHTPAAKGTDFNVYTDGVIIYDHFYKNANDDKEKEKYKTKILSLYDEAAECFPWQKTLLIARKAFDLYYRFPEFESDLKKFQMFQDAVVDMSLETPAFVINPFTALLINNYLAGDLSKEIALKYALEINRIIKHNRHQNPNDESWQIVSEYSLSQLESLEGEKGFYPCNYFKEKYEPIYIRNKNNCDSIQYVFGKLNWGNCDKEMQFMKELQEAMKTNCELVADDNSNKSKVSSAYKALREGEYQRAVSLLKEAILDTNDPVKKGTYQYVLSQVYYAHLKNFPKSREHASKAISLRPDWGDPHILIGKLYASSGPLCGSGRGWNSQVVTWVAIDEWNKAKKVDPSVASEANQLINKYSAFMPSKSDIFQRQLKEGSKYKVPCWIQRTTIIRTAK